MKQRVVQHGSNYTAALNRRVAHMSVFRDILTSGNCYRAEEGVWVNGPTVSVCFAERWVVGYDGYGIRRITSGPRSTQSIKGVGCT
jgi:hypothetical protein